MADAVDEVRKGKERKAREGKKEEERMREGKNERDRHLVGQR